MRRGSRWGLRGTLGQHPTAFGVGPFGVPSEAGPRSFETRRRAGAVPPTPPPVPPAAPRVLPPGSEKARVSPAGAPGCAAGPASQASDGRAPGRAVDPTSRASASRVPRRAAGRAPWLEKARDGGGPGWVEWRVQSFSTAARQASGSKAAGSGEHGAKGPSGVVSKKLSSGARSSSRSSR